MKLYRCFIALQLVLVTFIAQGARTSTPWNMESLCRTPSYEMGEPHNGVVEIVYRAMDYRGRSKEVFAYYSTPGILSGDRTLDHDLPAVVCVHGGGGEAFEAWVKIWAKRGYAAISMDQRGYGAGGARRGEPLKYGFKEGVGRSTPFFVGYEDQHDDWFYQAVGDVVTAHSLIRSFEEIDAQRTAIVGISWGGIITTLVSGLDDRFSVAVPVYGCGYLYEAGSMSPQIAEASDIVQRRWRELYDPSLYVRRSKIPMLFVNGTNDRHFHTNQWQKSVDLAHNAQQSMRYKMVHGHNAGWRPEEIYEFVDKYLKCDSDIKIPNFSKLRLKDGRFTCRVKGLSVGSKIYVISTSSSLTTEKAKWQKREVKCIDGEVEGVIESGCRQFFVSAELPSGANYSSSIMFLDVTE